MSSYHRLLLISSLLAVAPAAAHDRHGYGHHYDDGHECGDCGRIGRYAQQFPATVESLKGTIAEIRSGPSTSGIIEAWLKAAGGTVLVRLGPVNFLAQNGLKLNEGASITVKGYRAVIADDDLLIATEVEIGGKTLLPEECTRKTSLVS